MTGNTQTDQISTEDYDEMTDAEQIEYLKEHDKSSILDHDGADIIFEMRAGVDPEGRNLADNRRAIQLVDLPDEQYLYTVSDDATEYYYFGDLPPHYAFVQDAGKWIDFATDHGAELDDAYEFTVVDRDTDVNTVDLRKKIESDLEEIFG